MAKPEGMKQITMYVPADVLEQVDASAYRIRQRRNDRTTWILSAIDEKLARDLALIEGADDSADGKRVKEIVGAYDAMNETGREWLHLSAVIARDAGGFK